MASKADVDNVQVGGRNYCPKSKNLEGFIVENSGNTKCELTDEYSRLYAVSANAYHYGIYRDITVDPDTDYVLSFDLADIVGTAKVGVGCEGSVWAGIVGFTNNTYTVNGRKAVRFNTSQYTWVRLYFTLMPSTNSSFKVSNLKLEKGNKATDWTQAPEDVQVGARNLAPMSHWFGGSGRSVWTSNKRDTYSTSSSEPRGFCFCHTSDILSGLTKGVKVLGEEITISFDFKLDSGGTSGRRINVYAYQQNGVSIYGGYTIEASEMTTSWKRVSFTTNAYNWGDNGTYTTGAIYIYDAVGTNSYSVRNIKIERGNKATDWTPAPEDVDKSINDAKEAAIQVAADAIKSWVSSAGGNTSYTQTSTGFTWTTSGNITKCEDSTARTNADTAKAYTDAVSSQYGYRFKTDINVGGASNKYYPVYFAYGNQNVSREVLISRGYTETAPNDWNNATHKGGLTLKIKANYGSWGGATYKVEILDFSELYSKMVADVKVDVLSGYGMCVWLRGGGAVYHVFSDQQLVYGSDYGGWHCPLPYVGLTNGATIGWYGGTASSPTYKWIAAAPLDTPRSDRLRELQAINTAAAYMDFSQTNTNALTIGNKIAGTWSGTRAVLGPSTLEFQNESGNTVASYGTSKVELGKNSSSSSIEMCGGKAKIYYGTDKYVYVTEESTNGVVIEGYTSKATFDSGIHLSCADGVYISGYSNGYKGYIKDWIVEEGTSGIWKYRKWASGNAECWAAEHKKSLGMTGGFGNVYIANAGIVSLPFTFSAVPRVFVDADNNNAGMVAWTSVYQRTTTNFGYFAVSASSKTADLYVSYTVKGLWK